jgi:hypothetical protein
MVEGVTQLFCILEVPSSYIGSDTDYLDWGFHGFPQTAQANTQLVFLLAISCLPCNLLFKTLNSLLYHTTCFDQRWSSSGVSKIVDETAVLLSVSSIFGICPSVCAHMSVTCISILCITCVGVSYGIYVYVLMANRNKWVMCNRMLWYNITS